MTGPSPAGPTSLPLVEGYKVVGAPRFPASSPTSRRLRIGPGVVDDGGRFLPRDGGRPPTDAETSMLLGPAGGDAFPDRAVALFAIPDRLRRRWWTLAEAGLDAAGASGDWLAAYARELAEFLRFKGVPLPTACRFEATLHPAGQPSTRIDPGPGLALNPPAPAPRALAGINLSDEPTSLVFANLAPEVMARYLDAPGLPPDEVARAFLGRFPDYPLVRLALDPGDGYWLPSGGIVCDGSTVGQDGPAVMMGLRAG